MPYLIGTITVQALDATKPLVVIVRADAKDDVRETQLKRLTLRKGDRDAVVDIQENQAVAVYEDCERDTSGDWYWLTPEEAETMQALRDGSAVVTPVSSFTSK